MGDCNSGMWLRDGGGWGDGGTSGERWWRCSGSVVGAVVVER